MGRSHQLQPGKKRQQCSFKGLNCYGDLERPPKEHAKDKKRKEHYQISGMIKHVDEKGKSKAKDGCQDNSVDSKGPKGKTKK